jgi:hypothetical protein
MYFQFMSDLLSDAAGIFINVDENYVTKVGPRTIQLNYETVTVNNTGFYRCLTNVSDFDMVYIRVIR